jgi:hypothetical protein
MTPTISDARVLAVDVQNRRLTVELPSRQIVVVRMLIHGPADGVRVNHPAMPGRFTDGLVLFPVNDNRNGFWIGSVYKSQTDALTTNDDPFLEYNSHWSGAYEWMDGQGRWTKSFPDGTYIQVSDSTTKPTTYRHTVDTDQNQQLTQFTDSDRVPKPPSPRHLFIKHASGTTQDTDPKGNLTVTGAKGATCTLTFGGATVVIDQDGNIVATAAAGHKVELTANGGTFQIDKDGNILGNAAAGHKVELTANGGTFQIDQNGGINVLASSGQHLNVSAGGGAVQYTLVRTDLLVASFNAHIHSNGNAGGNTGAPVTKLTAGSIQSAMANVSE